MTSSIFPTSECPGNVLREASGPELTPDGLISALRNAVGSEFAESVSLTGAQARQLHEAILSSFNSVELEMLAWFELNEKLQNIAPDGQLNVVVLRMIQWAESRGRIDEFVRAVQRLRPENKAIQSIAASLLGAAWSEGSSRQEIFKATEIDPSMMEKLWKLEIERVRLIKERDEIFLKEETQRHRDDLIHEERMYELRTARL